MIFHIPALTDFKYRNSHDDLVDAPDPIESIYPAMAADYGFRGWITDRKRINLIYPGGRITTKRAMEQGGEKAFYVDESIRLWDDCSDNSEEDNTKLVDLCLEGNETQLSITNVWDVECNQDIGGNSDRTPGQRKKASVVSSIYSPEVGYFFRFPLGTQLSVASNDNFKDLIQFIGSPASWTTSFSMDMWAKVSDDGLVIFKDNAEDPIRLRSVATDESGIKLVLANRSQLIFDFPERGHEGEKDYNTTGYDMYFMIEDGKFFVSNFDPIGGGMNNEVMMTGVLSCNAGQTSTLVAEWMNILYGWTYFAFSYNADTTELIGYVKGNNADFLWKGDISQSDSQIIQGDDYAIPDIVREYGYLIGSLGCGVRGIPALTGTEYTYGYTPEISVKSFRVYDRALSYDELRKTWEIEKNGFRPEKIRTQFNVSYANQQNDGRLTRFTLCRDAKNTDEFMYTKVVTSSLVGGEVVWEPIDNERIQDFQNDWNAKIFFPRELSDYRDPDAEDDGVRILQNVPRSLFRGWTTQEFLPYSTGNTNADIAKISADAIYDFTTYPDSYLEEYNDTVISVGREYAERKALYPVILARAVYTDKSHNNTSTYINYTAGRNWITAATSAEIGLAQTWNGGTLQNYWTTETWSGGRSQAPTNFVNLSGEVNTWGKLSSFLYTDDGQPRGIDNPFHLYPVYKKTDSVVVKQQTVYAYAQGGTDWGPISETTTVEEKLEYTGNGGHTITALLSGFSSSGHEQQVEMIAYLSVIKQDGTSIYTDSIYSSDSTKTGEETVTKTININVASGITSLSCKWYLSLYIHSESEPVDGSGGAKFIFGENKSYSTITYY